MGLRQRIWAKKQTERLRSLLGGKCIDCGSVEELEFDVIVPVGNSDHHRRMDYSWRLSFYRKQYAANNLALRCGPCNRKKGDKMLLTNLIETPF